MLPRRTSLKKLETRETTLGRIIRIIKIEIIICALRLMQSRSCSFVIPRDFPAKRKIIMGPEQKIAAIIINLNNTRTSSPTLPIPRLQPIFYQPGT